MAETERIKPSQLLKALRNDRLSCPHCQSEAAEMESPKMAECDTKIVIFANCPDCEFVWSEIYSLSSVREGRAKVDDEPEPKFQGTPVSTRDVIADLAGKIMVKPNGPRKTVAEYRDELRGNAERIRQSGERQRDSRRPDRGSYA